MNIISFFDITGHWPRPFKEAGHQVTLMDYKHGWDAFMESPYYTTEYMDSNSKDLGLLFAPPCLCLTNTGARWWATQHDIFNPDKVISNFGWQAAKICDIPLEANNLLAQMPFVYDDAFRMAGYNIRFMAIENPTGRMASQNPIYNDLIKLSFQPHEFAGWLDLSDSDHNELDRLRRKDGIGITKEEAQFIIDTNAYTKDTNIWGYFNPRLTRKPIEPVKGAPSGSVMQRFGSDSEATKAERSKTPLGFAKAFYEANKEYQAPTERKSSTQLTLL